MLRRSLNWKRAGFLLATLIMLSAAATSGRADEPTAKAEPPKPLPDDIVKAWKKAGAGVRWMRRQSEDRWHAFSGNDLDAFPYQILVEENKVKSGDLPVFSIGEWPVGVLAKLPAPSSPFGLIIEAGGIGFGGRMTDEGLEELAGLKNLQALDFSSSKVTDAGLKELARLKNLQSLSLFLVDCAKVTDTGLKELAGLKNLQSLSLLLFLEGSNKVTDAGLKELAGLKNLKSLTLALSGDKLTDAVLKELAGLKNLQSLALICDKLTDAGLKELAGLKNLQSLALICDKLMDAGLKELAGLKKLRSLFLKCDTVSDAGIKELKRSVPSCKISR